MGLRTGDSGRGESDVGGEIGCGGSSMGGERVKRCSSLAIYAVARSML